MPLAQVATVNGKILARIMLDQGFNFRTFNRKTSMQNQIGISLAVKHVFRENKFLDDFFITYRSDIGRGESNLGPQIQE